MLAGHAGRLEGGGLRLRGRQLQTTRAATGMPHAPQLANTAHYNRTANTAGAACSKATCAKHAPVQTARRVESRTGVV